MAYKILYLQSTSEIGGSDVGLLRVVQHLDRRRFEPHVAIPRPGPLSEDFRSLGCWIHLVPSMRKLSAHLGIGHLCHYLLGYPRGVAEIVSLIRREGIHLVHTNTIHNHYGLLAAKLTGIPHVWHIREIVVQSAFLREIEIRLVKRFATRFIVISDAVADPFRCRDDRFPSSLVKLYDGVDLDAFHPKVSGQRIRQEIGLSEAAPLVGTISRLDSWKGLEVFLEAAALVHQKMPQVHFLVCGGEIEGHLGYEAHLRRRASSLGLGSVAHFAGWRYTPKDIPEVYGALNVSVQCPVQPEPMGLAIVEAMASGVAVITVSQGGPAELCIDGRTGILVPPRDRDATAQAILSLLENPSRSKAMGLAGRQRAEALFDVRNAVQRLQALYEEILRAPAHVC